MCASRLQLLEHVKSQGVTPLCENFSKICHDWLFETFPFLTENHLIDGKTVTKWVDYISEETLKRWKIGKNDWKPLLGSRFRSFFGIEIKISNPEQPLAMTNELETDMEIDIENDVIIDTPPIDLSDLAVFQVFECPSQDCDFKSKDRILFKTHVVKNHDYVKGEFKSETRFSEIGCI